MFNIKNDVNELYPKVKELRRQIHMNPEIAFKEFKTSALAEKVLVDAGIEVEKQANSTAVIGILRGGKPGKTIALRADMDALPLNEEVEWEGKSQVDGVMHACGHDMHTAILMGVASILGQHKEDVPGTVKFLFQPAEECPPGGAKPMIEAGALKNPDVDMVFGLHVTTRDEVGKVKVNYKYSSANSDRCNITIKGKGGHGAYPQGTVDAVVVASHVVVALQTIVSRNVAPLENGVISVGSIHSGTVNNIISETAKLQITCRSLTPEVRELLEDRIKSVTKGICDAMGATATVDYQYGYSSTPNDDNAADIVKAVALNVVGEENTIINSTPSMGGEDFSFFAMEVPGAFYNIGAKPDGEPYPGHNPKFFVKEEALKTGMEMMLNIVFEANK
ncbi:amidohydrolase [Clostridium sp. 'deep sea']|uniref:M20 metallopeptidase family protein n=1 Tax=Clostridium sp. 'deep sea' TaxID=2779445 RepID=UPI00189654B6|nr:amidohydrolase [Clostridium sp. 'deep sea']QOR35939.1 amidohydrolase [Clostridium sp. 'deep sea']